MQGGSFHPTTMRHPPTPPTFRPPMFPCATSNAMQMLCHSKEPCANPCPPSARLGTRTPGLQGFGPRQMHIWSLELTTVMSPLSHLQCHLHPSQRSAGLADTVHRGSKEQQLIPAGAQQPSQQFNASGQQELKQNRPPANLQLWRGPLYPR